MAHGLVVRSAIRDQRLTERRSRVCIFGIFDDGLAELADRLVEIATPAPRYAEAAIRIGQDRAITTGLGDRSGQRS